MSHLEKTAAQYKKIAEILQAINAQKSVDFLSTIAIVKIGEEDSVITFPNTECYSPFLACHLILQDDGTVTIDKKPSHIYFPGGHFENIEKRIHDWEKQKTSVKIIEVIRLN